jgi:hypothetical protein
MGKHKSTVLVQAIYGAFLRGDVPAILDKLSDNVEWVIGTPHPAIPTFGTFKGKDAIQKFFTQLGQEEETKVFDPHEYIAQYDKVVALIHVEAVVKKTGKPLKQDVVMIWTIKDNKVTHLRIHEDTAANVAAYS